MHKNYTEVQKVSKYIEKVQFPDPSPLHNFYKSNFNFIDIADKYWYKVNDCHDNWKWRSKMLFAIMRMAVLNSWSLFCSVEFQKWKQYHKELVLELIQFYF